MLYEANLKFEIVHNIDTSSYCPENCLFKCPFFNQHVPI